MDIVCNNVWPSSLPLPVITYKAKTVYATAVTDINTLAIARRNRFQKNYPVVSVQWVFNEKQYRAFERFVASTLNNGIALFSTNLRYPANSTLSDWMVRFAGPYKTMYADPSIWQLSAELELIQNLDIFNMRRTIDNTLRITIEGDVRRII